MSWIGDVGPNGDRYGTIYKSVKYTIMRAQEFIKEEASAGATVSGSMAPVAQTLGATISRQGFIKPGKYSNSVSTKKRKQNALG